MNCSAVSHLLDLKTQEKRCLPSGRSFLMKRHQYFESKMRIFHTFHIQLQCNKLFDIFVFQCFLHNSGMLITVVPLVLLLYQDFLRKMTKYVFGLLQCYYCKNTIIINFDEFVFIFYFTVYNC